MSVIRRNLTSPAANRRGLFIIKWLLMRLQLLERSFDVKFSFQGSAEMTGISNAEQLGLLPSDDLKSDTLTENWTHVYRSHPKHDIRT